MSEIPSPVGLPCEVIAPCPMCAGEGRVPDRRSTATLTRECIVCPRCGGARVAALVYWPPFAGVLELT